MILPPIAQRKMIMNAVCLGISGIYWAMTVMDTIDSVIAWTEKKYRYLSSHANMSAGE